MEGGSMSAAPLTDIFEPPARMNGENYQPSYPMTDSERTPSWPEETDEAPAPKLSPLSLSTMNRLHRALRPVVIEGMLRRGETMNVIAASKTGKTWVRDDLAVSMAGGIPWLGTFQTVQTEILILDNELHIESLTYRLQRVAEGRGMPLAEIGDHIHVQSLRGKLMDLPAFGSYLKQFERGRFGAIVIDAFYRTIPAGVEENDNGAMANLYNLIDQFAEELDTSFILIHHASKGSQAGKAITDIGSGAGSMSRAADTHLVLMHHEEPGAVVMDAACRSFAPMTPTCFRWNYPTWSAAPDLDPTKLRRPKTRAPKPPKDPADIKPVFTIETFVERFVKADPQTRDVIEVAAALERLSNREAVRLLKAAVDTGKVYAWQKGKNSKERFSTEPQPLIECDPPAPVRPVGRPRTKRRRKGENP
jgi:hypothetical protein